MSTPIPNMPPHKSLNERVHALEGIIRDVRTILEDHERRLDILTESPAAPQDEDEDDDEEGVGAELKHHIAATAHVLQVQATKIQALEVMLDLLLEHRHFEPEGPACYPRERGGAPLHHTPTLSTDDPPLTPLEVSDEDVEAAARAMYERSINSDRHPWDDPERPFDHFWIPDARAALEVYARRVTESRTEGGKG